MATKRTRILSWLVRTTFGLALVTLILMRSANEETWGGLLDVDPGWLVVLLVAAHTGVLLSAWKWRLLLHCQGNAFGLGRLFGLYLVGAFFSNFLPTMVGGDAVRVYELVKDGADPADVAAATIVERGLGFIALLGCVPLALLSWSWTLPSVLILLVMPMAIIGVSVPALFKTPELGWSSSKTGLLNRFESLLADTARAVQSFRSDRQVLFTGLGLSIAFYGLSFLQTWIAGQSLGIEISAIQVLSVVPIVMLMGAVPLTVNGLGLMEGGYAVLLVQVGMSAPEAISIALILRGRLIFTAVLGGLIWMVWSRRPRGPLSPPPESPA